MTKIKMSHKCERCGREAQYREACNHCNRKVCQSCIKNSKRTSTGRAIICKDCCGDSAKRKKHGQA
ncbi:hypothetical protein COT57_00250 [Candidatus Micrarchaeota archaeon CG09_land_8_20_14_0_10_55_25]|nr:MAG: hypothetical protein COT57_00250 [Candidatus Micrarchaeota archaeon CG09_land_8_20_14_0_10_55_25]